MKIVPIPDSVDMVAAATDELKSLLPPGTIVAVLVHVPGQRPYVCTDAPFATAKASFDAVEGEQVWEATVGD